MKRQRTGPEGNALCEYVAAQERLPKQAPEKELQFYDLVTAKSVVFRDVTPFFQLAKLVKAGGEEPLKGKVILIRPRRWGKSVLGTAWIEFLRGRADFFRYTWAGQHMRKEPLIGVHLDMSNGGLSVGQCIMAFMDAVNKGLELAERVQGHGEGAKGQRISVPPAYLQEKEGKWTVADCIAIFRTFLIRLESISVSAGRRVAIFVDEYDRPCISALGKQGAQFEQFNEFFREFYAEIKAQTFISFLFLTGSSRLPLVGFFSGANDISDVSYDAQAATALGYTWDEIETLYHDQLPLLEKLHEFTREELRAKMEQWYNKYRWSYKSQACVFNPLSVNMLMKTGEFSAHWTETGVPSLLLNKRLFQSDVLRLLMVPDAQIELSDAHFRGYGRDMKLNAELSPDGQKSILVGAGILTLSPECTSGMDPLTVCVPNREALTQLELIFYSTFESRVSLQSQVAVESYCMGEKEGDVLELLKELDAAGDVAKLAQELAGQERIIEKHVHQALLGIILAAAQKYVGCFRLCSELGMKKAGEKKKKWLDLAFVLRGQTKGYAVELECCDAPLIKDNSESAALRSKIRHGLEQLRADYQHFKIDGVTISERFYSCVLYGKSGRVIAFTNMLAFEEIAGVQANLEHDIADNRIVWLEE